jgi:hypothetical protein
MKQILPQLKQVNKHLSFLRKCVTKRGFRHATHYINGLIALNKKTMKGISKAVVDKESESALKRLLSEARFKQDELEERYLKKIKFLTTGQIISLIFDDTLVKREGKKIEETQQHKNHSGNEKFITGHQFFTSMIHTPILQLPLLPKLYSKNTESKIQMASDLVDFVIERMTIDNVFFDSWYSDKKIIKKCKTKGIKVVCAIKTNRSISPKRGEWMQLSAFTVPKKQFHFHFIDDVKYNIAEKITKLKGLPPVKMLISYEWDEGKKKWKKPFHLISTNLKDTPIGIIRQYSIRWVIETYHWDIKQNMGFAAAFVRKKQAIVRHSIFSSLAYAILKLFMFARGLDMTIGECISYIQGTEMDDFVQEIVEVEDKDERMQLFEEVFKRETAEV